MANQADIPTELTGDDITAIFQSLDATLGAKILLAQLIGTIIGGYYLGHLTMTYRLIHRCLLCGLVVHL